MRRQNQSLLFIVLVLGFLFTLNRWSLASPPGFESPHRRDPAIRAATSTATATPTVLLTPTGTATETFDVYLPLLRRDPFTRPTLTPMPDVSSVGLAGQLGGATYAVAVEADPSIGAGGAYAFAGVGPRIVALDLSEPTQPTKVGKSPILTGMPRDIYVRAGYAYVAVGDTGLQIVDVREPASPRPVAAYDAVPVTVVHGAGRYVYVAGWTWLRVLDVSDPTRPAEVGKYDLLCPITDLFVSGDRAYLTLRAESGYRDEEGLHVIDIRDPSSPREIGYHSMYLNPLDVYVDGEYAYVGDKQGGLRIVDVSDVSHLNEVGVFDVEGAISDVFVAGTSAYVLNVDQYGADTLRVVDVSDPTTPVEIAVYPTAINADVYTPVDVYGLHVQGDYAYIATGYPGLEVINTAHSTDLVEISDYGGKVVFNDIYVAEGTEPAFARASERRLAYLVGGGLTILDVSDSSALARIGTFSTRYGWNAKGIDLEDHILYAVTDRGLLLIDVSDPADPFELARCGSTPRT